MKTNECTKTEISTLAPARGSRLRRRKVVTSLAALAAAFGSITMTASTAHAQADYTNVENPMAQTSMRMLQNDDLVLTLGNETTQNDGRSRRWVSTIKTSRGSGTECTAATCNFAYDIYDYEQSSTTGRFFETAEDAIVTYPSITNNNFNIVTLVGGGGAYGAPITQPLPYASNDATTALSAAADFNGDGYDELLMVYSSYFSNERTPDNGRVRIASAKDVTNPSQGFNFTNQQLLGFQYGARSVTVGDFNGDGHQDFAVLFIDADRVPHINVYSVGTDLTVTLQSTLIVSDPIVQGAVDAPMQLVSGRFTSKDNRQLVLATQSESTGKLTLRVFDFTNAANKYAPVQRQSLVTNQVTNVKLIAGRFDWSSPYDSLAVMQTKVDNGNSTSNVSVLKADPLTLALSTSRSWDVAKDLYDSTDKNYVALDIAVGNFDNRDMTLPLGTYIRNPNLQLAIAVGYCQGENQKKKQFQVKDVKIVGVADDPLSAKKGVIPLTTQDGTAGKVTRMSITNADLQGRSIRLGQEYRIALPRRHPAMILAQPPQHLDYTFPTNSSTTPTVFNLSFAPDKFNATYSSTNSATSTASRTDTNGWGFSGSESIESTQQFQAPGGTSARFTESFTAQQALNRDWAYTYGSDSTTTQSITNKTGVNDFVMFDDETTYLYAYQIIGQTVCPSGQTTCADSAKIPATVIFTAPGKSTARGYLSAESLDWYQPTWENNNILSYPGNTDQLKYAVPDLLTLTDTRAQLFTDDSSTTMHSEWSSGRSQGSDVTSTDVFKENGELTVEAVAGFKAFGMGGSVSGAVNVNFGGSTSFGTVQTKNTSLQQSQGLTLTKDAQFTMPGSHGYAFTPVIYGDSKPANTFDGANPPPDPKSVLNVYGPLRSAYTVDPLTTKSTWFAQNYGAHPDIALNHPFRWTYKKSGSVTANCVSTTDGYQDCGLQNPRTPTAPWDDLTHRMRGFFIYRSTDANTADPSNQGAQLQTATAGEALTLEARVYNYSIATMPAGSRVHVNFYGMPWNPATQQPVDYVNAANPGGSSFLIGQTTTGPITPFNTDTPNPNFQLVSVPFNTSGRDGQNLVFWVVAWAENADGTMLEELAGKGLNASPTTLANGGGTGVTFFNATNLEPTVPNLWKVNEEFDPDTTSFSNNIGFYHQTFYIRSRSALTALEAPNSNGGTDGINTISISGSASKATSTTIEDGDTTEVNVTVHNGGDRPVEEQAAYFYDGDPQSGGQMFGMQSISHIGTGDNYLVRLNYSPTGCGAHDVYVQITDHGTVTPAVHIEPTITVNCDASATSTGSGGCSVTPTERSGVLGWIAALGAGAAAFFLRRKKSV